MPGKLDLCSVAGCGTGTLFVHNSPERAGIFIENGPACKKAHRFELHVISRS
jgi:hypothetical protein